MLTQNSFQKFCWNGQARSRHLHESPVRGSLGSEEDVHATHPFIAEMAHLDFLSIGSRGYDRSEAALEEDDTISGNIRFDKDVADRKIDWLQMVEQC
jgi:hypothetical protein